jgi:hypothetical protein
VRGANQGLSRQKGLDSKKGILLHFVMESSSSWSRTVGDNESCSWTGYAPGSKTIRGLYFGENSGIGSKQSISRSITYSVDHSEELTA